MKLTFLEMISKGCRVLCPTPWYLMLHLNGDFTLMDRSVAAHLRVLNGGLGDWHRQGLAELWFMVLVWILVADPIIGPMLLVSTLTEGVYVGRLSLLKTQALQKNAAFFRACISYFHTKRKAWECLIAKVNFKSHNSPAHHCPAQHAAEIVCQMRNWHHQRCNTIGSRVTTGTIKSGWLWDVYSTDLIFDRGNERTVGRILGQSTTMFQCICKETVLINRLSGKKGQIRDETMDSPHYQPRGWANNINNANISLVPNGLLNTLKF